MTPQRLEGVLTIPLPWERLPLSLNDRGGWKAKHFPMQDTIDAARYAIRAARIPALTGAVAVLDMWPSTKHRRDTDNMALTLKACLDALVAEGVVPDDSWVHVPFSGQRINPPGSAPILPDYLAPAKGRPTFTLTLYPPDSEAIGTVDGHVVRVFPPKAAEVDDSPRLTELMAANAARGLPYLMCDPRCPRQATHLRSDCECGGARAEWEAAFAERSRG